MNHLGKLNDEDYPAFSTGQAAQILEVQEAFLRSLEGAEIVSPQRSRGGHRRYTRRQLILITRVRGQLDEGHTLAAAAHIIQLEDELRNAHRTIAALRQRLAELGHPDTDGH